MTMTPAGAAIEAPSQAVAAAQQAMWLHQQLHPDNSLYNVFCSVRIEGKLDARRLEQAFAAVVARHDSLRTTFPSRGGVPQPHVAPADDSGPGHSWFQLIDIAEVIDVADLPDCLVEDEVARTVQDWCELPFDLATGPLLRIRLLRLAPERHLLVLCIHHIICDGESLTRLFDEVSALYSAKSLSEANLPALPAQYSDYVAWRRSQTDLDENLAWWKSYLAGVPDVLDVPADRPRPAVRTADGATITFEIPAELAQGVAELARQRRMSQFMVLLAGFSGLVARVSGVDDFVLSVPLTDRPMPEFEPLIGLFVNSLPLRVTVASGASFADLLGSVRRSVLEVLMHPGVSIDQLVAELQPDRSPGHTPLVQVAFSADLGLFADPRLGELSTAVVMPEPTTAKFDLDMSINAAPDGDGYQGILIYSTDLFGEQSANRLVEQYLRVLRAASAEPEQAVARLPLLAQDEQDLVLRQWSTGGPGRAAGDYAHEMFARQALAQPAAPAVAVDGREVSYAELSELVERKAWQLRRAGVGPEVVVGVLQERSLGLISTLLAILRAGGAYLPLSPTHPPAYLSKVLQAAGSKHVVVARALAHRLAEVDTHLLISDDLAAAADPASIEPAAQLPPLHPDNLAYVLFTSGSTGEPKGVAITHRSLAGLVDTMRELYHHTAADRVLQFANATFDITVEELFPTWAAGGCVVLSPDPPPDPEGLTELIAREGVTFTILTSSIWQNWVTESWRQGLDPAGPLRLISVGAETTDPDTLREWQRRTSVPVWNAYGLTETTVNTTLALLTDPLLENRVSIGRPINGVDVFVLDEELQPVPPGVAGEIYVGGDCLARGYLGRPELTAERFVPHPFSPTAGARLLRTGDAARWLPNGTLQPMGRLDAQIKVRGYRIEPGHIEAVLTSHPEVTAAAIAVRTGPDGQEGLVGYVVPTAGESVPADLRAYLGKQLPAYLVPGALVALDAIPRTANGKVDTKALPAPAVPTEAGRVQPATELEQTLARLWRQVLQVDTVSLEENFFDAGGTSLTLARLLSRINTDLGAGLSLVSLYEYP
ncbi:MAG: hypothetical protein QOE53_2710, partial [Pseudonocardiales bacterium]|nr:hypothetical protein [Pseudonocardiales bacterium]